MEDNQRIELILTPVPPDNAQSVKQEIVPLIEAALRENGLENLLASGQVAVQPEQTFPTDAETLTVVVMLSSMAKDTYKELILPLLKRKFGVEEKPRKKDDAGRNKDKQVAADESEGGKKDEGTSESNKTNGE